MFVKRIIMVVIILLIFIIVAVILDAACRRGYNHYGYSINKRLLFCFLRLFLCLNLFLIIKVNSSCTAPVGSNRRFRLSDMKITGTRKWQDCPPHATAAFILQEMFMVLICARDWVYLRVSVRREGSCEWKIQSNPRPSILFICKSDFFVISFVLW
jgi:hypothetical protein